MTHPIDDLTLTGPVLTLNPPAPTPSVINRAYFDVLEADRSPCLGSIPVVASGFYIVPYDSEGRVNVVVCIEDWRDALKFGFRLIVSRPKLYGNFVTPSHNHTLRFSGTISMEQIEIKPKNTTRISISALVSQSSSGSADNELFLVSRKRLKRARGLAKQILMKRPRSNHVATSICQSQGKALREVAVGSPPSAVVD
ncbi:hypothetical protein BDV93DRAFT_551864 [Ceratobasidium sp. AG-I]|nr:hypothetical protein BDV93DRAFT_551864 [Ceratobasidium sp. AG-I]